MVQTITHLHLIKSNQELWMMSNKNNKKLKKKELIIWIYKLGKEKMELDSIRKYS